MAANLQFRFHSSIGSFDPLSTLKSPSFLSRFRPVSAPILRSDTFIFRFGSNCNLKIRRKRYPVAAVMLLPDNPVVSDVCATALSGGVALSLLRLWAETAKRGLDQVLILLFIDLLFFLSFTSFFSFSFFGQLLGFYEI